MKKTEALRRWQLGLGERQMTLSDLWRSFRVTHLLLLLSVRSWRAIC